MEGVAIRRYADGGEGEGILLLQTTYLRVRGSREVICRNKRHDVKPPLITGFIATKQFRRA